MEVPRKDPAIEDVELLFEIGLEKFLAPQSGENVTDRRYRLRSAYAYSWQKIYTTLLAESSDWREREDPIDRLMGLFSQICDLEDKPGIQQCLHLAYMGLYNEISDHKVKDILYDNAPEGTYAVDLVREEIRQIASEADLGIPEDDVAFYTMYHVAGLHLTAMLGGANAIPNRFEVEMDYMEYLTEKH